MAFVYNLLTANPHVLSCSFFALIVVYTSIKAYLCFIQKFRNRYGRGISGYLRANKIAFTPQNLQVMYWQDFMHEVVK